MKICPSCTFVLPEDKFYRNSKAKDGLQGYCIACSKAKDKERRSLGYFKEYRKENAEAISERQSKYREANADVVKLRNKDYREGNKDRVAGSRRAYASSNPEKVKESQRKYQKSNRHRYAMYASKRRFVARQAEPLWLTPADKKRIELTWGLSELKTFVTGVEHEVDHIVPLSSKDVCGLHVPWNLRVIPKSDNRSKQNRHWPDMWEL
jgi:5-methylcytosine-specific restriction endonuclease McrA